MTYKIGTVDVIDANRNFSFGPDASVTAAATLSLGTVASRVNITSAATPITITSLGTAAAGIQKYILFTVTDPNSITLQYNATSLILPGRGDLAVRSGDEAIFLSLGSGNWKCVSYTDAAVKPIGTDTIFSAFGVSYL